MFCVGRAAICDWAGGVSTTPSWSATRLATADCTSKTSASVVSNDCCHLVTALRPSATSTSSGLTRTRRAPPARCSHWTVPVSRYCTPSSRPICSGGLVGVPVLVGTRTRDHPQAGSAESLPRISSVIPSAKYAFAVSPSLSNGKHGESDGSGGRWRLGPDPPASATRRRHRYQRENPGRAGAAPLGTRRSGRVTRRAAVMVLSALRSDDSSARAKSMAEAKRSAGYGCRARCSTRSTLGYRGRAAPDGRRDAAHHLGDWWPARWVR